MTWGLILKQSKGTKKGIAEIFDEMQRKLVYLKLKYKNIDEMHF